MLAYAGRCDAPLFQWDALPDDLLRLVLDKLSLCDLTSLAPTCREFRDKFRGRCAEERARLISVGEEAFGKAMFCAFVTAFRDMMMGSEGDACMGLHPDNCLLITPAGKAQIRTKDEAMEGIHVTPGGLLRVHPEWMGNLLYADLVQVIPGHLLWMQMRVRTTATGDLGLTVVVNHAAAAAAVGVLLAICTGDPKAMPSCWRNPLNTVTLSTCGVAKGEAEDLIGPLRPLAESFACSSPADASFVTPSEGIQIGASHPLGHLRLRLG